MARACQAQMRCEFFRHINTVQPSLSPCYCDATKRPALSDWKSQQNYRGRGLIPKPTGWETGCIYLSCQTSQPTQCWKLWFVQKSFKRPTAGDNNMQLHLFRVVTGFVFHSAGNFFVVERVILDLTKILSRKETYLFCLTNAKRIFLETPFILVIGIDLIYVLEHKMDCCVTNRAPVISVWIQILKMENLERDVQT